MTGKNNDGENAPKIEDLVGIIAELKDSVTSLNNKVTALEKPHDDDEDQPNELSDAEKVAREILLDQFEGLLPVEILDALDITVLGPLAKLKNALLENINESRGSEMNPPRDFKDAKTGKFDKNSLVADAFKVRIGGNQ